MKPHFRLHYSAFWGYYLADESVAKGQPPSRFWHYDWHPKAMGISLVKMIQNHWKP